MTPSLLLLLLPLALITVSISTPSLSHHALRQGTCSSGSDCSAGNVCYGPVLKECQPSDENCFCGPSLDLACSSDDECSGDDKCTSLPGGQKVCLPKEAVEGNDGDEKCIDAAALKHLQSHELVYSRHISSRALCDAFGSCATQGHIVRYAGKTMMMKNYCRIVECEERIIKVNSPRYSVGMRVPSKTDGLEYTPFAARYESVVEEAAIAAAIRMGL